MALLACGGVRIAIASRKQQAADQAMFRHLGVEPAELRRTAPQEFGALPGRFRGACRPGACRCRPGAQRTGPVAREIGRSLERLRTDRVDLIQPHNLVPPDEWETAFAGGGAIEAVIEAQAEGLVRYIGVTGHGVTVARQHLRSLEQYPFDSVLLPYNYPMSMNAAYIAEFSELGAVCAERGVAVQTIKAITRGPWGDHQPTANTWYQPLTDQGAIDTAVAWVLGHDGVFLNSVGDIHLLPKVIDAAERFTSRPSEDQMRDLEAAFGLEPLFI